MKTAKKNRALQPPAPHSSTSGDAPAGKLMHLELAMVELGPNYRRSSDSQKDAELRASLEQYGIVQPVLVRPWNVDHETGVVMSYQVVAGSRRVRLAKAIGLTHTPALVRTLSDREALELQLTENIQRTDVDPLDEADAFVALRDQCGYSLDELRVRSGKSATWVRERIALAGLCSEARDLYGAGTISAAHALELARLGSHQAQVDAMQAVEQVFRLRGGLGEVSVTELRAELQQVHFRQIDRAQWSLDDAQLLPSAGPCSVCPKRTRNDLNLFGDVEVDACTDGACWGAKLAAHRQLKLEELQRQGYQVLEGALAKKAVDRFGCAKAGFARLDRTTVGHKPEDDDPSLEDLVGEHIEAEERAIVFVDGEPVEVVAREALERAAKKARVKLPREHKAPAASSGDWKEQQKARERQEKVAESQRPFVLRALFEWYAQVVKSLDVKAMGARATEIFGLQMLALSERDRSWVWVGMPDRQALCLVAVALRVVDPVDADALKLDNQHVEPQGSKAARVAAMEKLRDWMLAAGEAPMAQTRRTLVVWWLGGVADAIYCACLPNGGYLFERVRDRKRQSDLYEVQEFSGVELSSYITAAEAAWKATQKPEPEPAKKAPAKKKVGRK